MPDTFFLPEVILLYIYSLFLRWQVILAKLLSCLSHNQSTILDLHHAELTFLENFLRKRQWNDLQNLEWL